MKILVVDDSPFMILVCKQTLEKAGYAVVGEAFDGQEAIEKAEKLKPDLIIMDIALPKINGFEAAKTILEALPGAKILVISAIDEEWVQQRTRSAGCAGFLAKPFASSELVTRIQRLENSIEDLKYG